jgi:hypothetical protein
MMRTNNYDQGNKRNSNNKKSNTLKNDTSKQDTTVTKKDNDKPITVEYYE